MFLWLLMAFAKGQHSRDAGCRSGAWAFVVVPPCTACWVLKIPSSSCPLGLSNILLVPSWALLTSTHLTPLKTDPYFFNWRVAALQCRFLLCSDVGQVWVCMCPLPHPVLLLGVIPRCRAELPVLYSSSPLAICLIHGSLYVSMLLSQLERPRTLQDHLSLLGS